MEENKLTPVQQLVVDGSELLISVVAGSICKKGIECIMSYGCQHLGMEYDELKPTYAKSVKRTIKISAAVVGGRIASLYSKDISSVMEGAFYGYNKGLEMAKNKNRCGGESEVLAGGSEEE